MFSSIRNGSFAHRTSFLNNSLEVGCGAVAYCRCYVASEETCCRSVLAKARVAPLKVRAIPRLELIALVLKAHIGSQLKTELNGDRVFEKEVRILQSSRSNPEMKAIGPPLRKLNPILIDGLLCLDVMVPRRTAVRPRNHQVRRGLRRTVVRPKTHHL
ncbi:hypothetical protein EWB00_000492 [Schistosoma japonicum]|uniref:Uncharacterized protein n=1 Tax=Schistosoma japonicum TaxID=6182 RepID=A0A4Z2DJ27_SCHJA|nr:hypothetical protein EWB00_000492 [Schistosoma japonicum]